MLWRSSLILLFAIVSAVAFPDTVRSRLYIGHSIYSDESPARFLGTISTNIFGDSILNTSGSYGSSFSATSIRNRNSAYGSSFSSTSAYSTFASRPPLIVNSQNVIVGYVTKNTSKPFSIDPDLLIYGLTALNNWNFYANLFYKELYAYNEAFLGVTTPDRLFSLSIVNESGSYGSSFSSTSIFNSSGTYGSEFSSQSAYNSFASTPPALFAPQQLGGQFAAYVTKNAFRTPAADPDILRAALLLAPDMPWITASSYLLEGLTTTKGTPSAARAVAISGRNLVSPVTVSLMSLDKYWEVSADGFTFGSEFQLQPIGGQLNATIYVRLSASAPLTANEPGGISRSGFIIATAYAGNSVYMNGSVVSSPTPTPTPTPSKKLQTITFVQPANQAFATNKAFTLSATASSGLSVAFSSSNTNVLSISGATATIKSAGSVTVTASQVGDVNYQAAPNVARILTVTKGAQSISFSQPASQSFAPSKTFHLLASNSTGLPVRFLSGNTNVIAITNNLATIKGAGSVAITATNSGNANYNPGGMVRTVTIAKATQAIRPFAVTNNVRFGTTLTFTNTNSSAGLPVTFERVSGPVTISNNRAKVIGVGSVVVRAVQNGSINYQAASPLTNSFTTVKAGQAIRPFQPLTNVPFGAVLNFTNNISSANLPVTFQHVSGPVTVSNNTARITGVGPVVVRAVQPGNTNYNAAAPLTNTFTTVKAGQTITWTNFPATNSFVRNGSIALRATSSSGLPVTYVSANTNILQIVGTNAVMKGRGTNTITARQSGNTNNAPAANVVRKIVIK